MEIASKNSKFLSNTSKFPCSYSLDEINTAHTPNMSPPYMRCRYSKYLSQLFFTSDTPQVVGYHSGQ